MFRGSIYEFIKILCVALKDLDYEWLMSFKDVKFKCRSKINEHEFLWDDPFAEVSLEDYLKKEFIKFYLQIFKWNKELADTYYVDV